MYPFVKKQRGLVPAIDYDGHLIYESGVIIQFLADLKPSHLLPGSGSFEGTYITPPSLLASRKIIES